MNYTKIKGTRKRVDGQNKSISIFLMSFVYPVTTGYLKRMDLLIGWANQRFEKINLIIPCVITNVSQQTIDDHLKYCDSLFLVENILPKSSLLFSLNKILYKSITGRYPAFHSSLALNKSLAQAFSTILIENKTDFFLNTRNNFGGLIHFVPSGVKTIFDTQDIFSEMYRKYSLYGKHRVIKKILSGYKETGIFFKSEEENLIRYDKIVAISENDFKSYLTLQGLKNRVHKISSTGFKPKNNHSAAIVDKEFDVLIIASDFLATQKGIEWFFNQVAPYFKTQIRLCVVGSLGNYISNNKLHNANIALDIMGIVDSVDLYYEKSKVIALCMLEGTGTSVKGLEAFAHGAAVVSTGAGVRFGDVASGKHCVISDEPEKFANSIEILLQDSQKREELGYNALSYAKEKLSLEAVFSELDEVFELKVQ
jgi:glycosyltransferase involved in cell wall biosynthesis